MSKIYNLIENQVSNVIRIILEENDGTLTFNSLIPNAKWVNPIISIVTSLVFFTLALFFGLYLWNYGLQPAFPGIVAQINPSNPSQASNPYVQLILTLIALLMFT
jgi:hypothetical protein